jgi:Fe-S-cluster-containing hydrogenase component 2
MSRLSQLENSNANLEDSRVIPRAKCIAAFNNSYVRNFIGKVLLRRHYPQERDMQKVLHINADKCTGCLQCEMACSFENYGTFATAKSRIKVFDFHHTGKKVPYTCTQCDEAWCLHACPVEAITVDKLTGAKVVNETTCVGCKVCTIACPFGTINYVQETGKVQKCDLCGGEPACADACPTGAITFIDANWTGLGKMAQWADKLGNQPASA